MSAGVAERALKGGVWLLAAVVLAGCGAVPTEESAPTSEFFEVTKESPFYKQGPAQAFGADFNVNAGQKVTMLKYAYGYSQVRLNDFITGYMATEDLKAIPPPPSAAKPRPAASSGGRTGKPRNSNVKPVANDPLFDITDLPAPAPPLPKP